MYVGVSPGVHCAEYTLQLPHAKDQVLGRPSTLQHVRMMASACGLNKVCEALSKKEVSAKGV